MTRTSPAQVRVARRARRSLILTLFATALVAACGGDSGSQPEEDGETSEARVLRPGNVRTLAVAGVTARSVELRFTQVSDGVNQPASYEVRYHPTPMGNNWRRATVAREGTCAYPVQGTSVGATLTCTVEGLNPGTSYDFQIMPFRPFGTSTINGRTSNIVSARTSADTGGPSTVSVLNGNGQTGEVGTPLEQPLQVKVKNSQGVGVQGATVTWSVSGGGGSVSSATSRTDDSGYAEITRVLGVVVGQNRTTAFVSGLTPVEFTSTAQAGPPASVSVTPSELALEVGEDASMQAAVRDRYGNPVSGASVTWASSNPGVATVDGQGRVVGLGAGTAGVTASTATAAGVISGSTMTAASPTAQAMSSGSSGLEGTSAAPAAAAEGVSTVRVVNGSADYPAEVARSGGNSQIGTVGEALDQPFTVTVRNGAGAPLGNVRVRWEITAGGGSLIDTVSTSSGDGRAVTRLVLGTNAGANSVRAIVEGLDPVTFNATGTAGPVASISVAPSSGSIGVGATLQFTATPRDQYGNEVSNLTLSWSSSATGVATVNSSGLASGIAAGSAQIRATTNGFTGSGTLTVAAVSSGPATNPGTVADLTVASTTSSSVTLNFTSQNDGAGNPARYQVRYAATPLGWGWGTATPVESGTCAGMVQGGAIGTTVSCTVTGLAAGNSYDFQLVSYRGVLDGSAVFSNLSNIATGVTGASTPTAQGTLTIAPRGGTLTAIGATLQLSLTARTAAGLTINSPGATWTSSNTGVATVDANGRVTARGLGTAVISVGASCCSSDQVSVSVTQQIASVAVTPGLASVTTGSGTQLSAVARDSNGNTIPGVTFNWNSSNSWVAPVNGSGYVTGSNPGSSTVTASAGGRSASAAVSVMAAVTGGGGGTQTSHGFTNVPSGLSQRTHARWGTGSMPQGWNFVTRQGTIRQGPDASSPTGGSMEMRYNAGHPDGHEPGVAWWSGSFAGADEVFLGVLMKYSNNWVSHDNEVKLHLFAASGAWLGIFDGCWNNNVTQWKIASRVLSPVPRPSNENCWTNNRAGSPTYSNGSWVRQEMYIRRSTGTVMLWINGTLVAEHHGVDPIRTLNLVEFQHAGTWGGGGRSVSASQSIFIAETLISTR